MSVIIIIIALIIGIWGWTFYRTIEAQKQVDVQVPSSPTEVYNTVRESFGFVLWKDVDGPGQINKRRRSANDSGPVISITIEPGDGSGTEISVWMSSWKSYFGAANFAGSAVRQRNKVFQRLSSTYAQT